MKESRETGKDLIFFAIAASVILLDQLTKFLVRHIELGKPINIIGDAIQIVHSRNYGAGFGLLQEKTMLLIFFSIFVVGLILYYYDRTPSELKIFTALILGGTIGNLIDRVAYGYVTDFMSVLIWPGFNIADTAITVGTVVLIIYLLLDGDFSRLKRMAKLRRFK